VKRVPVSMLGSPLTKTHEGIMENSGEDPRACPDRLLLVSDVSRRSAIRTLAGVFGATAHWITSQRGSRAWCPIVHI
jgi:hypothetical protein